MASALNPCARPAPPHPAPPRPAAPRPVQVETEVQRIWAEVLGVEPGSISATADFFSLGGTSIHAGGRGVAWVSEYSVWVGAPSARMARRPLAHAAIGAGAAIYQMASRTDLVPGWLAHPSSVPP